MFLFLFLVTFSFWCVNSLIFVAILKQKETERKNEDSYLETELVGEKMFF